MTKISVKKFLTNITCNKLVLYFLFILAILNLFTYLMKNNLAAIILFLILGLGTTYFTKNMVFVLLVAIVVTNIFVNTNVLQRLGLREGMKNNSDKDKDEDGEEDEGEGEEGEEEEGEGEEEEGEDDANNKIHKCGSNKQWDNSQKKCVPLKTKSHMIKDDVDIIAKAAANLETGIPEGDTKTTVNYAKTVETAFKNLENLLGKDGIKKMTADTAKLASKQDNLMDAMKKMTPMIVQAGGMLDKLQNISSSDNKLF